MRRRPPNLLILSLDRLAVRVLPAAAIHAWLATRRQSTRTRSTANSGTWSEGPGFDGKSNTATMNCIG